MGGQKSWTEKLARTRTTAAEAQRTYAGKEKGWLVIPAVDEIDAILRRVKKGRLMTVAQMMELLRQKHEADACCPMTTGIFAGLIAQAADEQERAGARRVPPWWRLVKADGELNRKWPEAGAVQQRKLEAEGHRIVRKGKRLLVADFGRALVGRMLPERPPARQAAGGLIRKVLERDDFGPCVLLPKTEWSHFPERGPAWAEVDGRKQRVTVQVEECNCRGTGWHRHRFLSLPGAGAPGARVTVAPA